MSDSRTLRRIGALAAALYTVYLLLDCFVIEKSYVSAEEGAEKTLFESVQSPDGGKDVCARELSSAVERDTARTAAMPSGAETVGSCQTDEFTITLYTFRADDTQIYAADVVMTSAQSLRTALAGNVFGRNITDRTSSIAADADAVLAINGDYYGARDSGLVIRNGVLYRDGGARDGDVLVVYADGGFEILSGGEKSGEELLSAGAWQAFSFGPGLVKDGAVSVSSSEEVGRSMASNPRTAIGTLGEGHYLFLVSDGRTAQSAGLSLKQLAELMASLGCTQAYNLDGGGSSTMVFCGRVVNNPTTNGRRISERSVSDIVYVG